ncbi:MAG: hypothetical protein WKF84_16830 [Pyrinomonadaceae bacterium]
MMKDYTDTYDDEDLTFYVQIYKDYLYAEACLRHLRRHYRRSRVIIISDGDDDPRYEQLAERYQADYTAGEALYPVENGGKMIQRMLDAFLTKPSSYFIKIDTDTRVHRRFRYLPKGRCVFGTLEWETSRGQAKLDFPNVQGGCTGFTLESAREIAESKLPFINRFARLSSNIRGQPGYHLSRREERFSLYGLCDALCLPPIGNSFGFIR